MIRIWKHVEINSSLLLKNAMLMGGNGISIQIQLQIKKFKYTNFLFRCDSNTWPMFPL